MRSTESARVPEVSDQRTEELGKANVIRWIVTSLHRLSVQAWGVTSAEAAGGQRLATASPSESADQRAKKTTNRRPSGVIFLLWRRNYRSKAEIFAGLRLMCSRAAEKLSTRSESGFREAKAKCIQWHQLV